MRKALAALALLGGISLTARPISALDYNWVGHEVHPGALVQAMHLNVDAYLPWNSGGSARAMGMAGAYTAIADGIGGAVEYNPAGMTNLDRASAGALVIFNSSSKLNSEGTKITKWTVTPASAGAAFRIGRFAFALSRRQPPGSSTYLSFFQVKTNLYAPDGTHMSYDTLSDTLDTTALNTYVLTTAIKQGRLSMGANFNIIKGDITRVERGRISSQKAFWYTGKNNRFDAKEKVGFNGYTADLGALLDLGDIRLGATAKNLAGNVKIKRYIAWQDNFYKDDGDTWNWNSPTYTETMTRFAQTYPAGVAFSIKKKLTVGLDYISVKLVDTMRSLGRVGAEFEALPDLLVLRAGLKTEFNSLLEDQNIRTNEYFFGTGLKVKALTVDASVSVSQVMASSSGGAVTVAMSALLKF